MVSLPFITLVLFFFPFVFVFCFFLFSHNLSPSFLLSICGLNKIQFAKCSQWLRMPSFLVVSNLHRSPILPSKTLELNTRIDFIRIILYIYTVNKEMKASFIFPFSEKLQPPRREGRTLRTQSRTPYSYHLQPKTTPLSLQDTYSQYPRGHRVVPVLQFHSVMAGVWMARLRCPAVWAALTFPVGHGQTSTNQAFSECQWTGYVLFCTRRGGKANCPDSRHRLAHSNYGASGEQQCIIESKLGGAFHQLELKRLTDFCCFSAVESHIHEDCDWYYHSSRIWDEIPFWGTGVRPTGKALIATNKTRFLSGSFSSTQPITVNFILAPLIEHGPSEYGSYCCNSPNVDCPREVGFVWIEGEPNWMMTIIGWLR